MVLIGQGGLYRQVGPRRMGIKGQGSPYRQVGPRRIWQGDLYRHLVWVGHKQVVSVERLHLDASYLYGRYSVVESPIKDPLRESARDTQCTEIGLSHRMSTFLTSQEDPTRDKMIGPFIRR